MEIKLINIDEIIPYENNPRNNDEAVEPVANSIKEFGFKVPIVIDDKMIIVTGHTRYKAAKKLNLKTVPCIIADDLNEEQIRAFRLADNKVSEIATWDYNVLNFELENILDLDMTMFDFDMSGIDDTFGTDFELSDEDKGELEQITFTLHNEQAEFIRYSLTKVEDCTETFGNTNKNGNALYELVKQWAEQKTL